MRHAPSWLLGLMLLAAATSAGAAPRQSDGPVAHAIAPPLDWGTVARPAAGPAQVIGGTAAGCLGGARALPLDGVGYQAVRVSRNRHFGHPALVTYVQTLGRALKAHGLETVYIGDMAQPRGGPMPYGHGSHQSGLDVDVWFNLKPKPTLPPAAREEIEIPSLVLASQTAIDRRQWRPEHIALLKIAAELPGVDRIFVHWTIKRELCQQIKGDRRWLERIRPWYGHNDHFHVRLGCPSDSPLCEPQAAVPPGDGCGAGLDWWFRQHRESKTVPAAAAIAVPKVPPTLPAACHEVLTGR